MLRILIVKLKVPRVGLSPFWTPYFFVWTTYFGWIQHLNYTASSLLNITYITTTQTTTSVSLIYTDHSNWF